MARREDCLAILKPGDVLLYKPSPGIGAAISWGEWSGAPGEALEYSHAGLVLDVAADQGFEQNPPETHYTKLSAEAWDYIDVWRVADGVVVDAEKLRMWCANDVGVKYPYGKYFRFIGAGLLARVGLIKWAQAMDGGGIHSDKSWAVCSATVAMALTVATDTNLWPKLEEDMRPCDLPLGRIRKVL